MPPRADDLYVLRHHKTTDHRPKLTLVCPGYANAIGNIIADLMIIVLPLPMIKGLNLPGTQKLVLVGIFCLGFL